MKKYMLKYIGGWGGRRHDQGPNLLLLTSQEPNNFVSDSDAGHSYRGRSRVSYWQEHGVFEGSDLTGRAHTWPTP
jgi:hypothetical protein